MASPRSAPWPDKDDPPDLADAAEVRRVRAVLALGGVPWDELDDGVQQVRLKLLEERAKPARPEVRNPLAWLTVVASRVASDWHRSQSREAGLRRRLAERWSQAPAQHSVEHQVLGLAVAEELESMPAAQRQVLVLRYYADLPIREIALLLQVPEGTIKSRLHTAHAAMRERLRQVEVI
ncbi:RNA polymerase sigma factor [Streptomyces europaeiscabiei]|uniref:RNA polymerase sigma factor n=1 Tax=Streptomyces europaeiscabiei TaxID=146819 RepID=UPI0029AB03D7|nr:sigma-70 family RNA polymerase sigma factor [Streptomyces europaeiscabiei]MDX2525730.1 sigma-70 family RNA polymerase sigma factor [Streptomyces europaeiscabiei]MDX3777004.1 sigma-70 family RNA polymerase sigma factor [Streptomyces europaeiscabiei]